MPPEFRPIAWDRDHHFRIERFRQPPEGFERGHLAFLDAGDLGRTLPPPYPDTSRFDDNDVSLEITLAQTG